MMLVFLLLALTAMAVSPQERLQIIDNRAREIVSIVGGKEAVNVVDSKQILKTSSASTASLQGVIAKELKEESNFDGESEQKVLQRLMNKSQRIINSDSDDLPSVTNIEEFTELAALRKAGQLLNIAKFEMKQREQKL